MINILLFSFFEIKKMRRNYILWFTATISILSLFLMNIFNFFTIEEQLKMIKDFSLGIINIVLLFFVIFYPIIDLKSEFSSKTIFFHFSTPVSKLQIFLGKIFSYISFIAFTLLCNFLSLSIIIIMKNGVIDNQLLYAFSLIFLKYVSILSFSILFALTDMSVLIATFMTFFVYVIGLLKIYIINYFNVTLPIVIEFIKTFVLSLIPNFKLFDVVEYITLGKDIQLNMFYNTLIHSLGISLAIYTLSYLIFSKREV